MVPVTMCVHTNNTDKSQNMELKVRKVCVVSGSRSRPLLSTKN